MAATCLALAGLALAGRPRVTLRTRGAAMRVVSNVEPCTEIFCNRAINMAHIQAVGFDMDYTLAEYCSETFDLLAYDGAVDKLAGMGYPEAIRGFEYDPAAYQRGLVLDKKRGNVLKMDRHKYVKVAYHGLTRLNSAERKAIYASSFETQVQSFVPPDYASVDTEFMLVDLALFCQLVDYKDRHPEAIAQSYAQIAKDIRHAVDLCHCDGVIKDAVAADPAKYIKPNPGLPLMFERLRAGGKQVFILTNSLYDFTNVVMSFLLGDDWKDHLDLVICGARKPGFLLDANLPIFHVREDQTLENVDILRADQAPALLSKSLVFQGGNWNHLHRLLGLRSGANLMYVGDHMYSDILRSKRTLGWRTVLIVPELDNEMQALHRAEEMQVRVQRLQTEREGLQRAVDGRCMRRLELKREIEPPAELAELELELEQLHERINTLNGEIGPGLRQVHELFHPTWGQLLKAGQQNSKWAQQVQTYACLYTSHVTNLALISPDTRLRVYRDMMPHELASIEATNPMLSGGFVDDNEEYDED
jgi:HAD superfamily 5'-nucleotidase-like hydrolase